MGGDGGCIANNRRYMRGAGLVTNTSSSANERETTSTAERERLYQVMTTCALSRKPLHECSLTTGVVACAYGNLYDREEAIESLLRRREHQHLAERKDTAESHEMVDSSELGRHVRGLKDLIPVRLQFSRTSNHADQVSVPVCPITGMELNGSVPAILIVHRSKKSSADSADPQRNNPNVISEKAIKEMGVDALQSEYGPFRIEDCIRLAPPSGPILDHIKEALMLKRQGELVKNTSKKSKLANNEELYDSQQSKRQKGSASELASIPREGLTSTSNETCASAASVARQYVASAVSSNAVLSSLFSSKES